MCKGLKIITTSMISRRSVHLGGIHIHKLSNLPVNNSISSQRIAELAFVKISSNPLKLNVLQTSNILFIDEAGQVLAELLLVLDMIFQRIRNNSIPFGGVLILCTMDHTPKLVRCGQRFRDSNRWYSQRWSQQSFLHNPFQDHTRHTSGGDPG